jgi:hypothetical protein
LSQYPDSPNATVAALRDRLFRLFTARRFDEAADYALALAEPTTRYSPIETIADRIFRRRPADALALYAIALTSAREVAADATSGAEGMVSMSHVRQLEKKLAERRRRAPRRARP